MLRQSCRRAGTARLCIAARLAVNFEMPGDVKQSNFVTASEIVFAQGYSVARDGPRSRGFGQSPYPLNGALDGQGLWGRLLVFYASVIHREHGAASGDSRPRRGYNARYRHAGIGPSGSAPVSEGTIHVGVRASSRAEESQLLGELQSFLLERTDSIRIERIRGNAVSQDPGTALLIAMLSSSAIVELAKGIADWMRKRHVSVTVSADGAKSLEGPSEHVEKILRELLSTPPPSH